VARQRLDEAFLLDDRPEARRPSDLRPVSAWEASTMTEREHDIVLLGATGFTGFLVAEQLAGQAPPGARIALAGRNPGRLAEQRDRLRVDWPLIPADVTDAPVLGRLAAATRVLVTTVGPYLVHGEPVVAACADAGTDYLDLTGEPEFVDLVWLRYDAKARASGARLVHACGFDSMPHDLGAQFTVEQLPADSRIDLAGYVRFGGAVSGGTVDSALTALSRLPQAARTHRERRNREGRPSGRRVRIRPGRPGYRADAEGWVLPLPSIDPQIVGRSAAALPEYGPDFSYQHYLAVDSPWAAMATVGAGLGLLAAAQVRPTRDLVRRLRPAGSGPSEQRRAGSWFRVRFVGLAPDAGRRVVTEVSGGDPGYSATSRMLAQAALCAAFDDVPPTSGQVTTAVAFGSTLRDRLTAAGVDFRVLSG
jgi:short subunit dehydrogenase-like uncharacterized protein